MGWGRQRGRAIGAARWAPAEGMTLRAGCTCRSFGALRRGPGARPQQGSQRSGPGRSRWDCPRPCLPEAGRENAQGLAGCPGCT